MNKAVIFDIDGTLLDSVDEHAAAWHQTFRNFGFDFSRDKIRYQIGKGGDKLLAVFLTPDQIERLGPAIEEHRAELFRRQYFQRCKPFPCVPDLFTRLRAEGRALAIASSGKKEDVDEIQKLLGIDALTDIVVTSDDVENSKPDPDVLQVVRSRFGETDASKYVFVGDSPHDAGAAQRDGMAMIGVLCGGFEEQDLRGAGASKIYLDPEDLYRRWQPNEQAATVTSN